MIRPYTPASFLGPRHFARSMLAEGLPVKLDQTRQIRAYPGGAIEVILFRESCWQIEIIAGMPGGSAPRHKHMHVDSCELGIGGWVLAEIGQHEVTRKVRGELTANLIGVPAGQWHGGAAGPDGVMWISFQRWHDMAPTWITDDWIDYAGQP